jgi:hypothetical protein
MYLFFMARERAKGRERHFVDKIHASIANHYQSDRSGSVHDLCKSKAVI